MFFRKTKQLKEENYRLFDENLLLNEELMVYKNFFNTVYYYAGNYPIWKIIFEYFEAIHLNHNVEPVGEYLEKLVLAVEKVLAELPPEEVERWKESVSNIRLDISNLEKQL